MYANKKWGATQDLQFSYLIQGSGGGEAIPIFVTNKRAIMEVKEKEKKAGSCGLPHEMLYRTQERVRTILNFCMLMLQANN